VHAETKVAYEFGCDLPEHMLFCDDSPSHCKVTSIRTGSNETTPKKKRIHNANIAETFLRKERRSSVQTVTRGERGFGMKVQGVGYEHDCEGLFGSCGRDRNKTGAHLNQWRPTSSPTYIVPCTLFLAAANIGNARSIILSLAVNDARR
jgi:hypothetical protein